MSSIPSSKNGIITIPTELRESLSCLDIVWSDMFETGDINPEEARKHEADFLKGAPLKWIHLVEDENSPMVKRDGFNDLIQLIMSKNNKPCLVTDVSLRYQSGSGGSTLAMQVLWHFRKDLRCARVINSDLNTKKLSKQVVDLFLLSNEEHTRQNRKTVLLLLDTKEKIKDLPIKNFLWEDLIDEIHKRHINTDTPAVIILNCIPTDFTLTDTMILPPKLSEGEMKKFKEKLLQQIRLQRKGHWKVTTVNLLHHEDSGGSALAREVLSELSEEFTCETLTEPFKTDTAENIAEELLRVYETHQNTVLYLLDHEYDRPLRYLLKNLQAKLQRADQTDHPAFIIINAVSKSAIRAKDDVKLKMELLPDEEERFAQKKKEKYKKMSLKFHAFNIMQGGFKKEDAEKLITEEIIKHVQKDRKSSSTRLLSFLALINSYVPGSHLSELFCEEFMDQTEQTTDDENHTLETRMKPFMDLIVISSEGDQKVNYIRLAHPMIAHACLKMLNEHNVTRFDIAQDFLNSLVKGKESNYGQICKSMLVTRLECLVKKETFSKLFLDIMDESENTVEQCICLLKWASDLFSEDPFYPQTLARLYYIKVKEDDKYEEARKWAEEAINRDTKNSHIRDTLGQVHKNHLLNETKKPSSDINKCLAIARSAIKAFKEEEEAAEDEAEDNTKFNNRGLFGFLQVCKIIHPKTSLNWTPLEHIEQEHSEFISSLKGDVETKYDFFEWYLAFSRQSFEREDPDYIQKEVEECYMYYFKMDKQDKKKNKYSGELLHILKSDISVLKQYKSKNPQSDSESQTVLYILANIICSDSGEQFEKIKEFQARLQKLWLTEMQDRSPEFYLLILLLFWPDDVQPAITNPPNLDKCLRKMRHSYKSKYQKYLCGRYLLPLFFLAKRKGLQRLIYTSNVRQTDLEHLTEGDGSEEISDLQRIDGQVRDHKVFAITGEKQIQVTPHDRASVCKQGQVSFYLGFNIRGPVAYNIRYEDYIKSCETLEPLLRTYTEQVQELCRLYDTHPQSDKGQKKVKKKINTAAKQIAKLFEKPEDHSFDVSSIPTTLKSGIEIIKRIQQREDDSDLVQPCRSQCMPRGLSDTERLDVIQHDQQMMKLVKHLTKHLTKYIPAAQRVIVQMLNDFRKMSCKMGINTASQIQCQTCVCVRDSAEWDLIEPFVTLEDAQMKYRLNLTSGSYECNRTGLRIECSRNVQLKYHICDWECVGDFPEMEHFTPCGPLMDIAITSGKPKAVYLPHFLCLGASPIKDEVQVLHVEDSGNSFENCELTRFHAKLLNQSFSPKGLLLRSGLSVNYHCETLIYETQKAYLTLHVYLIPSDKKMIEAVENIENKSKARLISKPGPVSSLQTKTWYSLRTLDEKKESECSSEVQPKQLELKYKPIKPNFFEVFIDTPKDFHLQLMPQHDNEGVWDAKIRHDDYSQRVSTVEADTAQKEERCKNDNGAEFVEKHWTELIQRVSLVEPIADDMKCLIGREKYQAILNSGTTQAQMRTLLGFLTTPELKEKLYQSLVEHEPSVVECLASEK